MKTLDIWEKVIEQIKNDLNKNDESVIYEMLKLVPMDVLIGFLPEEDTWNEGDG